MLGGEYTEGKAPTICLEEKHFGKEMSYKDARCMVIDEVALMYGCDKSCLKAQLDKAYQDAYTCGDLTLQKSMQVMGVL